MEKKRIWRIPWAIALLIVAAVVLIALLAARVSTCSSQREVFSYVSIDIPANMSLQVMDDGFVYYDGSSIGSVSTDAKVRWSYLIGNNADFYATRYGVAAWSDASLTIIDSSNGTTTFSGRMELDVLSARVDDKYAAVLLGPEHNSTIVIMEKGGRKVNSFTLSGETVIDYGFLSNESLLWVMSLDTSGTVPSCSLKTYKPGKDFVGYIHDNEQLIYGVVFASSYYYCVGDTYVKMFQYNKGNKDEKSQRKLVYGWNMVAVDDAPDDPMVAFVPNGQYENMQDVRMIRASLDQRVHMPFGCQSLVARGDRVYGFSTQGYVMIAAQGQDGVNAYRMPVNFDRIYGVTGDNVAVLGSGSLVYMVALP